MRADVETKSPRVDHWIDLDEAAAWMTRQSATGALEIIGDRVDGTLYFRHGRIAGGLSITGARAPLSCHTRESVDQAVFDLRRNSVMEIRIADDLTPLDAPSTFDASEWFVAPDRPVAFGVYRLTRTA